MTATASLHPTPDTQGRSRLWSVFWLQGVIPSNILWAVALWALVNQRTTLLLGVFAVLLLYTGWIIPAVWRGGAPPPRQACLLVAGDYFLFAAERPILLPASSGHLRDQLAAIGPALRPQLLACELSFGRHRNGATPWQITHSTLPGRVGDALLSSYWNFADPASLPAADLAALGRYPAAGGWQRVELDVPTATEEVPA